MRLTTLQVAAVVALTAYSAAGWPIDLTAGAGAATHCPEASDAMAFNASAVAYLQPAPLSTVDRYGDGHYAPSPGSNTGIGVGYGELTGEVSGLCLGVLFRAEYRARASKDLLDVLVANHFGNAFDAGRTYNLRASEYSFKADGVRLRRLFDFDITDQWSTQLGVGVSLLKATEGQEDTLTGEVTATSSTYAVGTATWLQTASNLNLANFNPFVASGSPSSRGFSTDVELRSTSTTGWSIDGVVIDAFGRLYWKDVPQSLRTLNNAEISYNANLDRDAFIMGIDSRVHYTQDLAPKYHFTIGTPQVADLSGFIEDDFVDGLHFPSLGARYGPPDHRAEMNYDLRTRAVGLGGKLPWVSALISTNDIRIRGATCLGVSIQAARSW